MQELPKAFIANEIEDKWTTYWKEQRFFHAQVPTDKSPYCIVMPPPNITGALHMGHALVSTLQDTLIRWRRMMGDEVLWVPGVDHAGISTQTVVERHLMKTVGKRRVEFKREEFLEHIWNWKEENHSRIANQLRQMGCSCDWERERFTMDDKSNRAVLAMFKKLYDQGLIYRGDYLVNWDPVTETALADDEVEYEERQSFLWHFKYPLEDGSGAVSIATTRPETLLGDTAVAVNPKDERYTALVGKTVLLPLMNRSIPIIADPYVDPEFGTGVVKITPAHDPNDYEMGLKHNLPFINILTPNAQINENGGPFVGLAREEARKKVVEAMKQEGFLEKVEPHTHRVGVSYRSKAVVEPYLSKQWFVKMEGFRPKLRALVENKEVEIIPESWQKTYFHWIDNLRDWCISRQLWWGHRIPIWYRKDNPDEMICWDVEGDPPNPQEWVQDEDVLDTWFSSALWPFSTLGWPEKTPELDTFYPNAILVTGHDILFFWVARMLLMGQEVMGHPPFPQVFLHGLIFGKSYWRTNADGSITYASPEERRDFERGKPVPNDVSSRWEKMSKSKGNIIDPLEVSSEFGTDAMRMALAASATQAREIDLDVRRFEEFRNFANKVWNGARFVLMNLEDFTADDLNAGLQEETLTLEDRWILSTLNHTIQQVNTHLKNYHFDQAALTAYDFFWKEFCAYYVEIVKASLKTDQKKNKQRLLTIVLTASVRLLHPMAPFITEEIFSLIQAHFGPLKTPSQADPYTKELIQALSAPACTVAPYPQVLRQTDIHPEIEQQFALIQEVIYAIRNIRGEMKIPPKLPTDIHLIGNASDPTFQTLTGQLPILSALIRTNEIHTHHEEPSLGFSSTAALHNLKILIPLPRELLAQEKTRLEKEHIRLEKQVSAARAKLDNTAFTDNAPAALVEKHQNQLTAWEHELAAITTKLTELK